MTQQQQQYPYVDKNKTGDFVIRTSNGNCLREQGKTVTFSTRKRADSVLAAVIEKQAAKARAEGGKTADIRNQKPTTPAAAKKPAPAPTKPAAKKAVAPPAPAADAGGDAAIRNYNRASLDAKLEAKWRAAGMSEEEMEARRKKNAKLCAYTRNRRANERAAAAKK